MRTVIFISLLFTFFVGCKEKSEEAEVVTPAIEGSKAVIPMIRAIRFFGTEEDFGIELNGERAFLQQESITPNRIEIPYEHGLELLEDFYSIPGIENYRGKKSDDRQTSVYYLVHIFDEMPQHYSEEWVDYIIPKNKLDSLPRVKEWFDSMYSTQKIANAEQDAAPNH